MKKYKCSVCGYVYNPETGDPIAGIAPGTPFEALPHSWACPKCNALKDKFHAVGDHETTHELLRKFYLAEDVAYYFIAVILFIAAISIIGITITHFLKGFNTVNILNVVNDILLVVIILEIFSTVLIYLTERRISLTPFILIGLISSIRRILMVTAMMSARETTTDVEFSRSIQELVVSAGIVLTLIVCYYILSKVTKSAERCIGCTGFEKRDDAPPGV
ncbi:MAG: rubredoxin [Nitrospinae bacterium]|nr:rubredoxin [Nitrospinota bacterium]